jgi:hypothetical protein
MKIQLTKHNMVRFAQPEQLEQFKAAGWVESSAKPSKKKKSEKTAEIEPEAAQEDLDNANQGE